MITLYQHPVSPFCITIEAILKYAKAPYRTVNLPYSDRRIIVEKTQGQYYKIPLLEDGDLLVWDKTDLGQEIAGYLDGKFKLELFPPKHDGLQLILARYLEHEVEAVSFKLNDLDYEAWLPDLYDRTMFVRHKERKFGAGCLAQWRDQQDRLQQELEALLFPLDRLLAQHCFLIDHRPRFVDVDLFGVLGNYLFSGRNQIPPPFTHLHHWHREMTRVIGHEASAPP
ncbi:MAG: glutathione S-transferase N-terminal domain-containing protein [Nitrospirota bacterium]